MCASPGCGSPLPARKRPHGWCDGCYLRWLRAGKPPEGPPAPQSRNQRERTAARLEASRTGMRASYERRLATFRELADAQLPNGQIARVMGLDARTIHRYRTYYKPLRKPYEQRLADFRGMTEEHWPVRQIALALNVSVSTVLGYRRLGRKQGWLR